MFLLIFSFLLPVMASSVEYTNYTSMDEGRFQVWWTYVNESETFYFKLDVEARGWIGFGFTQLIYGGDWMRNGMDQYDVLVGGVYSNNGTSYGLDYLTVGRNRSQYPDHVDDINDWTITSASEESNRTTLEFHRKRVTSEPVNIKRSPRRGDISVTPGLRYFVWAYHKTLDTPYLSSIADRHDKSGLQEVMLLPELPRLRPTARASGTKKSGATGVSKNLLAFHLLVLILMTKQFIG